MVSASLRVNEIPLSGGVMYDLHGISIIRRLLPSPACGTVTGGSSVTTGMADWRGIKLKSLDCLVQTEIMFTCM